MRLESRKYLRDIQQAAGLTGEFLAGKSFDDHTVTPMLRAAVERQCEILGEALVQLATGTAPPTAISTDGRWVGLARSALPTRSLDVYDESC